MPAEPRWARSGLRHVWSSPEYRALLVANAISGVSVASYIPLIPLFLVQTLGADEAAVGLFMLTFVLAPVVGLAVGRLSDRLPSWIGLIVAIGVWTAVGRVTMGLAPGFGTALVVAVVFGAFSGVVNAQKLALLRDVLDRDREPRDATVASVVRTGYSFGWMVGPVLGGLVVALRLRLPARPHRRGDPAYLPADPRRGPARRIGDGPRGAAGPSARVELAAMPAAGALADRWGMKPVLAVGFVLGGLGFLAFAAGGGLAGLALGQVLNACFIAVILGLGSTYAQQQHTSGAGFATSVFFGTQTLSVATGGLIGGGSAALLGLPAMFIVPAALCAAAGVLLVITPRPH